MIDEQSIALAVSLNRETVRKNIIWEVIDAPFNLTNGSEDIVQVVYWTIYSGKKIVIYNRQYRHYFDEEQWSWSDGLVLAIVSEDFKPLWMNYEPSQALGDLFKTVTKQASGFNDLLDELLL